MGECSRVHIGAIATCKYIKSLVDEYKGKPQGLRAYLLKRLTTMDKKGDELLAGLVDEIF